MEAVLILLAIQGLLGAFDTLYHHEYTEKLPWKENARKELLIHGIRNFFYFILFISLGWIEWRGTYAYFFGAIFLIELMLTLWDFVVEDQTRKLPATERITHTILTLNYGLILATLAPVWYTWIDQPTQFVMVNYGILSWIAALYAMGVLVWSARDLLSAAKHKQYHLPELGIHDKNLRYLITGGSGFIGTKLCQSLINAGCHITILCRNNEKTASQLTGQFSLLNSLDDPNLHFDIIINLAGESISTHRWTKKRKQKLLESRLNITQQIIQFIQTANIKPKLLISGSAIGYYGASTENTFTEESLPIDQSFPHQLCQQWENMASQATANGVRVVTLRTGIVLGNDGGALAELLVPFDLFMGGPFGSGKHWMSWIHINDVLRLLAHIINNESIHDAINATAPNPVTNQEFTQVLGNTMHRPTKFTVPEAPLKFILGEMAEELLFKGQRVLPDKAIQSGFEFQYPTVDSALKNILGK